MKLRSRQCAITILTWVVGLVVLFESWRTVVWARANLYAAHVHGVHPLIALWLAVPEIVAAILFLIRPTRRLGGYALLAIFALAILVHALHGQWNFGVLLVYAAAVWVALAD